MEAPLSNMSPKEKCLMARGGVKSYFGNTGVIFHRRASLSLGLKVVVPHLEGGVHHGERDVEKVWSAEPALPDYKRYTSLKNYVCSP